MNEQKLRSNCLSLTELVAQGIALISPTMTAALIIPVMFSNMGNMSWLAYAVGTAMLLFTALNLNQFARRSTSAGSMYAYVCRGLGLVPGGVAGWSLVWAYLGIAMAGVAGFSIFAGNLLLMIGIHIPTFLLFAICVCASWYLAWSNVQLSAVLMLLLEGISMLLITILCFVVLWQHAFVLDASQFHLSDTSLSNLGLGVVVAIFSLVGFESATAFGTEARDPLKSIPRAVIISLVVSGIFFVFVTYVMVYGIRGYSIPLDQIDKPLNVLAQLAHVAWLQIPLSLGAMLSFFALCLSCINAGSRVIYAMGRHGLLHSATANAHDRNETPHVAVTVMSVLAIVIPTAMTIKGLALLDIFNYVGTLAAFGFLVPYFLITLAAPVYLSRLRELRLKDLIVCGLALLLLLVPVVGSVYPVPDAPVRYFPYLYLVYLIAGIVWIMAFHKREQSAGHRINEDLNKSHAQYTNPLGKAAIAE